MSKFGYYTIEIIDIFDTVNIYSWDLSPRQWYDLQYRYSRIIYKLNGDRPFDSKYTLGFFWGVRSNQWCYYAKLSLDQRITYHSEIVTNEYYLQNMRTILRMKNPTKFSN